MSLKNETMSLTRSSVVRTASPLAKSLAGLAALAVAMGIGRFAFTPVMPMMLQDGGLTIAAGRWLASANYVGYLIGALAALVVNVRAETAIRGGLLTIGLTTSAMALPLPLSGWLLLRLLAGVASAWVLISSSAWCLDALAATQRPLLVRLVFAGVGIGIAGAGLVCLALTSVQAGSASAWEILGILAVSVTMLIWRCFTVPAQPATAIELTPETGFRWSPEALRLVCCYGVCGFGYIIPATFLPVMAQSALSGSSAAGWSWPLFGLASAASTLTVAGLARRLGDRRLWLLSQWVMAAGIVMPALSSQLLTIMATALCVGCTFMVITLAAMQEARKVAPSGSKALMAAMTAAFAAGQIIGPLTVRAANGHADFSSGLTLAAAMLAIGTCLLRRRATEA